MIDSYDDHSEAFAQLLAGCERQLFTYILALVWNMQDAEDLFQQTAMSLWAKFDKFEQGTNFASWAFTTARLLIANYHRAQQRHKVFLSAEMAMTLADHQAAKPTNESNLLADALVQCMDQLNESDRRLINLCYISQRSIKQVALQVGRTVQGTYNSLCRIRRRLYECTQRAISRRSDA